LCLLFSMSIFAKPLTILSGKITESDTHEVIMFASVALFENGKLITGTESDFNGLYHFKNLKSGIYDLEVSYVGLQTTRIEDIQIIEGKAMVLNVEMKSEGVSLDQVVVTAYKVPLVSQDNLVCSSSQIVKLPTRNVNAIVGSTAGLSSRKTKNKTISQTDQHNEYGKRIENTFLAAKTNKFSTFGIDVDRASYSITRQYINQGQLPPPDAVRAEELINYFSYDYAQPKDQHPFAVHTEWANCPWNKDHFLLSVALQGECSDIQDVPVSNLTFLLDVSGYM